MKREGLAQWMGKLQDGEGWVSTRSGALQRMPYSYTSRFIDGKGTNPEELIGAAHAGCFSMAFSGVLEKAGFMPQSIETTATITLDKAGGEWTILASHLSVEASVPGIDEIRFRELAEEAKANCPVSRLLNADLTVEAKLNMVSPPRREVEGILT